MEVPVWNNSLSLPRVFVIAALYLTELLCVGYYSTSSTVLYHSLYLKIDTVSGIFDRYLFAITLYILYHMFLLK